MALMHLSLSKSELQWKMTTRLRLHLRNERIQFYWSFVSDLLKLWEIENIQSEREGRCIELRLINYCNMECRGSSRGNKTLFYNHRNLFVTRAYSTFNHRAMAGAKPRTEPFSGGDTKMRVVIVVEFSHYKLTSKVTQQHSLTVCWRGHRLKILFYFCWNGCSCNKRKNEAIIS